MSECPEVGDKEGTNEGASDGALDGTEEGASEGINDASPNGLDDGTSEGESAVPVKVHSMAHQTERFVGCRRSQSSRWAIEGTHEGASDGVEGGTEEGAPEGQRVATTAGWMESAMEPARARQTAKKVDEPPRLRSRCLNQRLWQRKSESSSLATSLFRFLKRCHLVASQILRVWVRSNNAGPHDRTSEAMYNSKMGWRFSALCEEVRIGVRLATQFQR
jgi:hypothetical protein